jgi:L-alanine-DL-glutamate epimerase-like enolase superfamily enzyme
MTISPQPKNVPDSSGIRITAIETVIPDSLMPGLLLLRIHTDQGFIGHGETYYAPHAVAAMIHDWMGRRLLQSDPLSIESHWRFLYERCSAFGGKGAELRALSAIDLALWDILGQVCEMPVWQLLGGKASTVTTQLVSFIVGSGRGRELPEIADKLSKRASSESHREVAEVRSSVALTPEQQQRLSDALTKATGKQINLKIIIDPLVLGGLVATVGDTVIDGTVRTRLDQLKSRL